MQTYPYIFKDTDTTSQTLDLWCIRWGESWSEDGFKTKREAQDQISQYFWDKKREAV